MNDKVKLPHSHYLQSKNYITCEEDNDLDVMMMIFLLKITRTDFDTKEKILRGISMIRKHYSLQYFSQNKFKFRKTSEKYSTTLNGYMS
ncbi:3274_t:CDS:2 [Diversispora eburnea]|uniref:3274_t:CDS:1 n=1 Tax=Diversispora eburnea TaxID=1213867 RepID=A0A9N8W5E6_9GLOM|nr:3274_t:CDS:2 [Diversispora eburnea]